MEKPEMRNHDRYKKISSGRRAVGRLLTCAVLGIGTLVIVMSPVNLDGQKAATDSAQSLWIRPAHAGAPLIWGRRDGIVFGLPSAGGLGGPRGLIRVGIVSPTTGKPALLNFIAIEPVVMGPGSRFGRMAFSELEPSQLDPGQRGKRLWVGDNNASGTLQTIHVGRNTIERLSVPIEVERFAANGAHVHLIASVDSDHPDELRLKVFRHKDSPRLEELTVTATMGNYERLRLLWLRNRVVKSLQLYEGYQGDAFVEHANYPLDEMLRTAEGDAIVLATSNEEAPWTVPSMAAAHWHYSFPMRLTQYWRVRAYDIQPDLRVRVNGRRVYWASENPVPGGVAFENFEVRERYIRGQSFIFGITRKEPWQFDSLIPGVKQPVH